MAALRRRLPELATLVASTVLSIGLGLALLAAYAGVRAAPGARDRPNIELQDFVRDRELGWLPPPNLRWRVRARPDGPASLFLATNRLGLRGQEPDFPPAGEVMLLGDSYVQGYFLSERETIPAALSRRISGYVYNLGVGGYSTDQEYTLLQRVLRHHTTRHVVVMFFINDLVYLDSATAFDVAKPVYKRRDGRVDFASLVPVAEELLAAPVLPESSAVAPGRSLDTCCFGDRAAPAGQRIASRAFAYIGLLAQPRLLFKTVRSDIRTTKPTSYDYELPDAAYADPHALDREWDLAFQFLRRIRDLAAENGADTLVFMIPEPAQVVAPHGREPFFPQQRFREHCDAARLRCLEPSSAFVTEQRRRPLYWADDNHLTPAGADFVAALLASELTR